MTKLNSIFANEGNSKIVEKLRTQLTVPSWTVLKIGKLSIVKRDPTKRKSAKTFLLTKDFLFGVTGKVKEKENDIIFNCTAKITLGFLHLFPGFIDPLSSNEIDFFQLVKNDKSLKFRAENLEETFKWENLLKKLTIQNDFFDCFSVSSILGKGSSAKVYKVQEHSTQKLFACKRFKKQGLSRRSVESIIEEIKLLRHLQGNKHIVDLEYVFESENSIYIITELCEGGRCTQRKTFYKPDQMTSLGYQLLSALSFLKQKKIVHRDLKPDNVLLKYKDVPIEKNCIKIIDFGLSVDVDKGTNGKNGGTIGYMAPESLLSKTYQPTFSFDIYAIGIILYNGLTGLKLFGSSDHNKMLERNRRGIVDFENNVFASAPTQGDLKSKESS